MASRSIHDCVRELRTTLGHTQQSFAALMHWSIASAVRYENGGRPGYRALTQLVALAIQAELTDLAKEFQSGLLANIMPDRTLEYADEDEVAIMHAAQLAYGNPKRRKKIEKFLGPELELVAKGRRVRREVSDTLGKHLMELKAEADEARRKEKS